MTSLKFVVISVSKQWHDLCSKNEFPTNVMRWYNLISSQDAVIKALELLPEEAKKALQPANSRVSMGRTSTNNRPQEGKFVELPGAEMGKVVVRFPPEASGYFAINSRVNCTVLVSVTLQVFAHWAC